MLNVACHWLRAEQQEYRKETRERRARQEEEGGDGAIRDRNPNLIASENLIAIDGFVSPRTRNIMRVFVVVGVVFCFVPLYQFLLCTLLFHNASMFLYSGVK